ncbi:hypothetical protein [Amycolatopsis orientalis]|uniref:hypothetical protein n=1 Tax=Amycolatopsis orientalis TaxID=31958 RepID=UPI0003AAD88F|nr:hypothetical protein [Amycolatopsis orientalis]
MPTTSDAQTRPRIGALAGACYVLFFLASLVLPNVLGQNGGASLVTPYSTNADLARYLAIAGHGTVPVAAFCQAISALALLVFAGCAADYVHRIGHAASATLTRTSGTVAAAFLLLSASVQWILSLPNTGDAPSVYRAVLDLSFITGAAAQVTTTGILIGAIAAATRTAGRLPSWLNWLGLTAAALSVLSVLSLLFKDATPLLPLGRYLGMAWFLALAVLLPRRSASRAAIRAH